MQDVTDLIFVIAQDGFVLKKRTQNGIRRNCQSSRLSGRRPSMHLPIVSWEVEVGWHRLGYKKEVDVKSLSS